MKYQDLVDTVHTRAALERAEQARTVAEAVLSTLAHCLPHEGRHQLADHLPGALRQAAEVPGPPEIRDGTGLITEVAERLGVAPERARYLAQAVTDALRDGEPDLVADLERSLASDVLEVLAPAGEPPGQAASVRSEVPTELSDAEIGKALGRLTGWTGDHTGIARSVALPADRLDPLVNRVQREARSFNDHARVDRDGDTVTFTLRTGHPGVVTEPDISLAERIDTAIAEVGSGG